VFNADGWLKWNCQGALLRVLVTDGAKFPGKLKLSGVLNALDWRWIARQNVRYLHPVNEPLSPVP